MTRWQVLVAVAGVLLLLWAVAVTVLYVLSRRWDDPVRLRDAVRLLPDTLRLLRRLVADRSLPRGVRLRVAVLLAYLLLPIDLVPDFVPVIGYADDVIVVALVLRSVVRRAGRDALQRHWPGTEAGMRVLERLINLPD